MLDALTFTLLGSGSSGGVPRVGNQWGKCDPKNPRNRRRRCALLIERQSLDGSTIVLIDAGADLREQLLSAEVDHLDGVLLTHSHADHIFGLDDLRQLALTMKKAIPVHMDTATEHVVMKSFGYVFHQAPQSSYPAFCTLKTIQQDTPVQINGAGGTIDLMPVKANHGDIHSLGFRVGNVAYLPDMKSISDDANLRKIEGLEVLIVDALREIDHPAHMSLLEALAFIEMLQPRKAVLTNMHSDLDYENLKNRLPFHVEPAFDGMQLTFSNTTERDY